MKFRYAVIYLLVSWVVAFFAPTSDLAQALGVGLFVFGVAWILVALVNLIIKSLKP